MNKPLVVGVTTVTLLFGGAGVATASTFEVPATTTTTVAQAQEHEDDGGDNGLWGLAGLLGLIGLAGLMRRKNPDHPATRGDGTITNNPRA
jgi:MYXO-CTERM domain-containing protein